MPGDRALYGRELEVGVLEELLDRAPLGGGALLLGGEPGVGKSALLDETRRLASERGMMVLRATGFQSEARMPFAGLHQLLAPILDHIESLSSAQRDALLGAFGSGRDAPDLFLIALAALSLLAESAARAPILVAVDDAHWFDSPSCEVLTFVSRRLESDPIVLLISSREGAEGVFVRAELLELHLEGLGAEASAALLHAQAPDLTGTVRQRLLAEADGNPLALMELPIAWRRERGRMPLLGSLPLTARLEHAFAARARELPAVTRAMLLVAALNDENSLAEMLQATAALTATEPALEDLMPAQAAGLVEASEHGIHFRHSLVRSAIGQATTLSERLGAHAALAGILGDQVDRRIWHLAACALGPDEEIAGELEATASRVQRRHGAAVAVAALQRAAELSTDSERRGARLLRAAELAFELGRNDVADALLKDAESLELVALDRSKMLWLKESLRDASGAATVESSIALAHQMMRAGETDLALNSLLTAAYKCFWFGSDKKAGEAVVAAAEQLPISDHDARLLTILAMAAPIQRGATVIDRLSEVHPDDDGDPEAMRLYGTALTAIPEFELAARFLSAAIDGLRAEGRLGLLARALQSGAWTALWRGNWSAAMQLAEEASRLARETAQPRWSAASKLSLAYVVGLRGDMVRAETLVAEAEQVIAPIRASPTLDLVLATRGALALSAGRHAEAYGHTGRMFDPSDAAYNPLGGSLALVDFVEAAAHSDHTREAQAVVDTLQPLVARIRSSFLAASLMCARAMLADDDDAERLFHAALGGELARWPFLHARLLLAQGAWLRRQRRMSESRAPLRTAGEAFDALGAVSWGERARQGLRASGETPRRRTADTRDDLTPQELQIGQLAAEGLTNREIGERLFLSHRTVGSHLYRIFPKLGISSRSELRLHPETRPSVGPMDRELP
jgi:DNA-binding CsgD family transcriptional regulator/tetratricopeptide (TPR) repeat protein